MPQSANPALDWHPDPVTHSRRLARAMAISASALVILVVPAYQIAELFVFGGMNGLWWQHALWRAPVLAVAVVALAWCHIRSDGHGAAALLRLMAVQIMAMMFGLFVADWRAEDGNVQVMIQGLIMSTFAVSLIALSGARELLIIYLLPASGAVLALTLSGENPWFVITRLFDSLMMLAVGLLAAELLCRTRLQAFQANRQLHEHATTDALTGLGNRRLIEPQLTAETARALRHRRPLSILLADIDHFKQVNDRWGHEAGDVVLRALAGRLRDALRQEDLAARWGGEEFLILLPDTTADQAGTVAEKIRQAVAATPFPIGAANINLTISLGVAAHAGESDHRQLVKRADEALYQAKSQGRNRVCIARTPGHHGQPGQ